MTPRNMLTNLLDSDAYRRLAGSPIGSRLFDSAAFERLDLARRAIRADLAHLRRPDRFAGVTSMLLFIGHTKSGGSLIGSLLDAHPDVVLADETDVLRLAEAGLGRHQIFDVLVRGARREAMKGRVTARRIEPYSLAVPGLWQGRHRTIEVIGDSRAGRTTRRLADAPDTLTHLRTVMDGIPIRFVQVIRNPVDPISAMMLRSGRSADSAIADYFGQCDRLTALRSRPDLDITPIHYEDLVADPEGVMRSLCVILGIEPVTDHLAACSRLVDTSRASESSRISWSTDDLARIRSLADRHDFLARYVHVG